MRVDRRARIVTRRLGTSALLGGPWLWSWCKAGDLEPELAPVTRRELGRLGLKWLAGNRAHWASLLPAADRESGTPAHRATRQCANRRRLSPWQATAARLCMPTCDPAVSKRQPAHLLSPYPSTPVPSGRGRYKRPVSAARTYAVGVRWRGAPAGTPTVSRRSSASMT